MAVDFLSESKQTEDSRMLALKLGQKKTVNRISMPRKKQKKISFKNGD